MACCIYIKSVYTLKRDLSFEPLFDKLYQGLAQFSKLTDRLMGNVVLLVLQASVEAVQAHREFLGEVPHARYSP